MRFIRARRSTTSSFVTMIVLDILWMPAEGALGAAKASSVAYVFGAVVTLWVYPRCGGAPALDCLIPRWSDFAYVREIGAAVWSKVRRR